MDNNENLQEGDQLSHNRGTEQSYSVLRWSSVDLLVERVVRVVRVWYRGPAVEPGGAWYVKNCNNHVMFFFDLSTST